VIETAKPGWQPVPIKPVMRPLPSNRGPLSWLKPAVEVSLAGTLVLLPVQFMVLPLNMSPVELWNLLTLPVLWLYMSYARPAVRTPYLIAMWVILLGSFIGTFGSHSPLDSFVAIAKDLYLYVWFVTVAALFGSFDAKTTRRVMLIWTAVAVAHGALIMAQFASPAIFQAVFNATSRFGPLDQFRPSGLFSNANGTGLYQLMAFVPLVLARPPRMIGAIVGVFLLASILATGSLAASAGFAVGLLVALFANGWFGGFGRQTTSLLAKIAVPTLILGMLVYLFFITRHPELLNYFDYIFINRVGGSADGRYSIWERGLNLVTTGTSLWGVGPDAYRDVDLLQKGLHNDALAFAVERGVIGLLGLVVLAATGVVKAIQLLLKHRRRLDPEGATMVVCLSAMMAALVNAQFHQIFHDRSFWLVLALQEAMLLRHLVHSDDGRLVTGTMSRVRQIHPIRQLSGLLPLGQTPDR
jgi:O-antigen ligase